MPVLTRKRWRLCGDFSVRDPDGVECHFKAGDELPAPIAAMMGDRAIEIHKGHALLVEIGSKPAPRPAPPPPRTPTPAEILRDTAWPAAAVLDGTVTDGPRGWTITVIDKPARESDLKRVMEIDRRRIVVHQVDEHPAATISLARLAQLLAIAGFGSGGR